MHTQTLKSRIFTKPGGPKRPPRLQRRGRGGKMVLAAVTVIGIVAGGAWWSLGLDKNTARPDLLTQTVHYDSLQPSIVVHGNLEAAENTDIVCRVKARSVDGRAVFPTIRWLVEEGTLVKKGDLLVQVDDSGWQEELANRKVLLEDARALRVQAEEDYKIVVSQNQADRAIAENNLRIAEIDLPKYEQGDYEQQRRDLEGRIAVAESDVSQWEERVVFTQRMARLGYRSNSNVQSERNSLQTARIELDRLRTELSVLQEYGHLRIVTELAAKLAEARRNLDILRRQAHSKELQADVDRLSKKRIYHRRLRRYHEIEEEIAKCKITAPHDGLVVYCTPAQARARPGSQQAIIAQGEEVREGQRLMQVPNLGKMVVNALIPERYLLQVDNEDKVLIRLGAFPDRLLRGRVQRVAELPSQIEWFIADAHLYAARIAVDVAVDGLLPGMSAEVTIFVEQSRDHILTVPLAAIVGSTHEGATDKCYVMTTQGPAEREVIIGATDEKVVEIRTGLREGDEVILNPRHVHDDPDESPAAGRSGAGPSP